MKKIFTVLTLALAMGIAFTGCASKNAKNNGPKVYRVDIGSILEGPVALGEKPTEINITSLFGNEKLPVAGETVRIMWAVSSDADINKLNVNLGDASDDYVLASEIEANYPSFYTVNIPVKEDLTGDVYANLWTDVPAVCETTYVDAK